MPANPQNDRKFWFPAKRYGWGWGPPLVWQGWLVLIFWLATVIPGALFLAGRHWIGYAAFMIAMSALLIAICFAKGEPPGWRWGKQ